jgi:replicative DNA helicase
MEFLPEENYLELSAAFRMDAFISGISASVDTPCISTGFESLDRALDGGLYEGLYIIGAISSLGKTSFVTQIGDQIAKLGEDVLIFSLEMSAFELIAKSISRCTFFFFCAEKIGINCAKTARGITTGKRYLNYSEIEKNLIKNSFGDFHEYAKNIYIVEGVGDVGVTQIQETINLHVEITGKKPVVIVDYLQILAPFNLRATDKQNIDKAVLELKRLSRDFKIPIIAISSLNRANYSNAVSMEAFKESGAKELGSMKILMSRNLRKKILEN